MTSGWADGATAAGHEDGTLQRIDLPPELDVAAAYGIAARKSASPEARRFADFILAAEGQRVLERFGFARS